ncbi:MAG: hypothetical protein PF445_10960 [Melioribacteraceae bacterium]|jgi:hypothetical protein|nr:hypothetical protein [Melioribacteraceae bacterium]
MSQTINLVETDTQSSTYSAEQFEYPNTDVTPTIAATEITVTESTLHLMYPGQMLFSIKEVATILNVSYEFIRVRTASQVIPTVGMGFRRMINIETINYLINNGV